MNINKIRLNETENGERTKPFFVHHFASTGTTTQTTPARRRDGSYCEIEKTYNVIRVFTNETDSPYLMWTLEEPENILKRLKQYEGKWVTGVFRREHGTNDRISSKGIKIATPPKTEPEKPAEDIPLHELLKKKDDGQPKQEYLNLWGEGKINENTKITLTIKQLKRLVKESKFSIAPDTDEVDSIEGPVIGKVKRPMYIRTRNEKKGRRVCAEVLNAAKEILGVREETSGAGGLGGYIYGEEISYPIRHFKYGWSNDSYYDLYCKEKLPPRGFYVSLDGDLVDDSVLSKEDEEAFTKVLTEIMEDEFQTEDVIVSFKKGEYPEDREHDCIWREWIVDFGDDGIRERW